MFTISLPERQHFFGSMVSLLKTCDDANKGLYLHTLWNCADQTQCLTKIFGHAKARIKCLFWSAKIILCNKIRSSISKEHWRILEGCHVFFSFSCNFWYPTFGVGAPLVWKILNPPLKSHLQFHRFTYLFVYFSVTVVQEKMVYWVKLKSITLTVLTQGKRLIFVWTLSHNTWYDMGVTDKID